MCRYQPQTANNAAGKTITDKTTHLDECNVPGTSMETCNCPNAKTYTDAEARKLPQKIRSRLVLRANKMGAWVYDMNCLEIIREEKYS